MRRAPRSAGRASGPSAVIAVGACFNALACSPSREYVPVMKQLALAIVLVGCASAPAKPVTEPTGASSQAMTVEAPIGRSLEKEPPVEIPSPALAKSEPKSMDPLAIDASLEASSVPKIDVTPKKELRAHSRGELAATATALQQDTSVEQAAKHAVARLGKPTWVENGNKRVWVAVDGSQCHRLVLAADGSVDLETMQKTERTMLSALARQNPCTGEVERGVQ